MTNQQDNDPPLLNFVSQKLSRPENKIGTYESLELYINSIHSFTTHSTSYTYPSLIMAIEKFTQFVHEKMGNKDFNFYDTMLPQLFEWAIDDYDLYGDPIPLLTDAMNQFVVISTRRIRYILANAFFFS